MALSMNKVILIGNLGRDCETRFTADNSFAITTFSIATSRSYKNREGAWTDETTWHNIVTYNATDYTKENLLKGKKVCVEGRISNRQYTDKDGNKRYSFEIVAESIILLDPRSGGGRASGDSSPVSEERFYDQSAPAPQDDSNNDLPF